MPYLNVVAEYPAGSRQPVWAALFREGHYQLFIGDGKARLFLKGKSPSDLFNRHYSVIRHPLRKALVTIGADKMTVEVYAFENDYPSQTISLDLNPYVLEVAANQLGPKSKALPLADLADFFNRGVTLEAAEIDGNANFYLYGTPSARQTLAARPQSIEDLAVVYRSMFHYGYNAPYISLDRHEDNRYAKVNFGGLLEDTRIGNVVLEADKLFKTMSTGLDPNTRVLIKRDIKRMVPDFLTSAERKLKDLSDPKPGYIQIRYWFYPDQIRSATDGRIGVVERYQLLADAERMDMKVTLDRADRDTIDHLNRNFADYARALPTYQELNTVGRMMAIVTWLQQIPDRNRVDLDELLSVELSPFKTPRRTKKLLALTAATDTSSEAENSMGAQQKIYNLDAVLEEVEPSIDDKDILELALRHFRKVKDSDLIPSGVKNTHTKIDNMKAQLESLRARIESERMTLDQTNQFEINRFNAMIGEFNSLRDAYNRAVSNYNEASRDGQYNMRSIVSVGGGINLRPKDFAKSLQVPESSPLIQRIRSSREVIRSSPLTVAGTTKKTVKRINEEAVSDHLPRPWKFETEQSTGDLIKKRWTTSNHGNMGVESNSKSGYMHYRVTNKGYFSEMTMKPGRKEVLVATSGYPYEIVATGDFSQGKTIVLRKDKKIERQILQRDTNDTPQRAKWVRSGKRE
ncbi:MAG: hypothetical protein HY912_21480 [Desulfomonile tiedjei]|uniref:Uncharacterized protein n=1 Tax=Desulfomonile tiedjei TaxID=2358 RepID=A0A9D6Z5K3_9BACT|nr:hypothetical protein [Desulfomonile tiedjei]